MLIKQQGFCRFFNLQKPCFYLAISMLSHCNIYAFTPQNDRFYTTKALTLPSIKGKTAA